MLMGNGIQCLKSRKMKYLKFREYFLRSEEKGARSEFCSYPYLVTTGGVPQVAHITAIRK
jgi:hypothetical protein